MLPPRPPARMAGIARERGVQHVGQVGPDQGVPRRWTDCSVNGDSERAAHHVDERVEATPAIIGGAEQGVEHVGLRASPVCTIASDRSVERCLDPLDRRHVTVDERDSDTVGGEVEG